MPEPLESSQSAAGLNKNQGTPSTGQSSAPRPQAERDTPRGGGPMNAGKPATKGIQADDELIAETDDEKDTETETDDDEIEIVTKDTKGVKPGKTGQ